MAGGAQFQCLTLGSDYAGFTIYFYEAGTTTGKDVYVDEGKSTAVQQIRADSKGTATWYADGMYRMRILDADGILLYDWDNVRANTYISHTYPSTLYATLNEAVSTIGSDEGDLYVTQQIIMDANLVVPSTLRLHIIKGGSIDQSTYTLTINGQIDAGLYQIFDGTGTVTFGSGSVEKVYSEWWGAVVNNAGTDSSSAIISAISSGKPVQFSEGTYYASNITWTEGDMILRGMGSGTIIKQNNVAGSYVIGRVAASGSLANVTIEHLVVDGYHDLGTFTGAGHGIDLRTMTNIRIDDVEIKECYGHGLVMERITYAFIDNLISHDNIKFGASISDNLAVSLAGSKIIIGKATFYNNGYTGTGTLYSGIMLGDTDANSGFTDVHIGTIIAHNNALNGVSIGTNAVTGTAGSLRVTFDNIISFDNDYIGLEIHGSENVSGNSVITYSNGRSGLYISCGDNSGNIAKNIQIGNVQSWLNNRHGVYLGGILNLSIGSIIAYNNSQESGAAYDGVYYWAGTSGIVTNYTRNGNMNFGYILVYDDQTSATQRYGLNLAASAYSYGHIYIDYLRGFDNVTADFHGSIYHPVHFGKIDVETQDPAYATPNASVIMSSRKQSFFNVMRTTDIGTTAVIAIEVPEDSVGIAEAKINGRNSGQTVLGSYHLSATYRRVTGGDAILSSSTTLHSVETDAGLNGAINVSGTNEYIYVFVTGLAGTTIDWDVELELTHSVVR